MGSEVRMIGLFPHIIVHLILLEGSHGCNGRYPALVGCGENKWVPCPKGGKQPTKQAEQTTKRGGQEEEGTANWFPSPRTFSDFPDDQKTPKGPKKKTKGTKVLKRTKGTKGTKGIKIKKAFSLVQIKQQKYHWARCVMEPTTVHRQKLLQGVKMKTTVEEAAINYMDRQQDSGL